MRDDIFFEQDICGLSQIQISRLACDGCGLVVDALGTYLEPPAED
jgi:hypothetical protein